MGVPVFASENTELTFAFNFKMKVVNIAYAMIKLQFKLPQTLISFYPKDNICMPLLFSKKGSID